MTIPTRPHALASCAIGSLPHTQLELAVQFALQLDIPTLPQLPRTDPSEYMLPQALDGFPGLLTDPDGRTSVDPAVWERAATAFGSRLDDALAGGRLEAFEPGATSSRAWRPFLWEVEHRKAAFAKAQLTGPLTATWATTLVGGAPLASRPDICAQLVRLVVVRALAMARALAATGARPIIFLDEPGLYAYDKRRPTHVIELQELLIAATALRREGALVGVHCCGNTDWAALFRLPLDIVSADVRLSLASELAAGAALDEYLARGGLLALGIIPTNAAERLPVEELVDDALALMGDRRQAILASALVTPACGLALRSVAETERVYDDVRLAQKLMREA